MATQVSLTDFGPIHEASVELKPLTVLIGPNNSGKSYAALAVYSLCRTLSGDPLLRGLGQSGRRQDYEVGRDDRFVKALYSIDRLLRTSHSIRSLLFLFKKMPARLKTALSDAAQAYGEPLAANFGAEVQRCFGTEIAKLVRRPSEDGHSTFSVKLHDSDHHFKWAVTSRDGLVGTDELEFSPQPDSDMVRDLARSNFVNVPGGILGFVLTDLLANEFSRSLPRAHYLPASRSGILLGHKTLASVIVRRASLAWVEPMDIPRLPGAVIDLIEAMLLLDRDRKTPETMQQVASFIESEVLHGIISVSGTSKNEYPEVVYETSAGRFALHQVSSMVSEVAPLVMFLKYMVRPGDMFIFEEPESHLDASNQLGVARAIAMLVRADVKVLITTHSDYFLKQLNNLMVLSSVSPRHRPRRGYQPGEVLSPDKVGAYLFKPTESGTTVECLTVTPDEGISTERFGQVHRALYDQAVLLEHLRRG